MSFKDIKGQEKAIQFLKSYIKESRLPSAYLFAGPDGIGKRLIANIFARALNCQEKGLDSCDSCPSCLKIEKNQHPDVRIVDAIPPYLTGHARSRRVEVVESDSIKIDYIRQLQKDINLKAYEGRKKVFIIDNAHKLTDEAAGAILKILEEPPKDSLIIIVTSKPALLFKTIISRCRILKFSPLARPELERILKDDYSLESVPAHFLAYFSEGRLGYALRLKDTDVFREKNRIIDAFVSSRNLSLDNLSVRDREELRFLLNILAGWFRDIYLVKTGISHSELINLDRRRELLGFMNRYSFMDLDGIFDFISASLLYLQQNINMKLLLANLKGELWKGYS